MISLWKYYFHFFYSRRIQMDTWWIRWKICRTGNYKTIIESGPATLCEHMECLMVTRWQSIFKERMNFLRSFFLHAPFSLIITIESFTRTRYPRAQQNSFSSPPGGGQSSPPGPSSSSLFPVHLVSLHRRRRYNYA